jgi:transcriptional regulator
MYIPRSFRDDDAGRLHDFIRHYNFGTLFSQTTDGPLGTHLPFLLDAGRGDFGTLIAHVARANPHWRSLDTESDVLVTFLGPHAYISPAWYTDPVTVPTWNYAAVHATGPATTFVEPARLRDHVLRLVQEHEGYIDPPWDAAHAEPILESQLGAIVGIEIRIRRLEGKFKFNQNRSRADQEGVVAALSASPDSRLRDVAGIMQANLQEPATTPSPAEP